MGFPRKKTLPPPQRNMKGNFPCAGKSFKLFSSLRQSEDFGILLTIEKSLNVLGEVKWLKFPFSIFLGYWKLSAKCKICLPSAVNLSRMCKLFTGPTVQANFIYPSLMFLYLQSLNTKTDMKMWRGTHFTLPHYLPCSWKLFKSESVFKGRLSVQSGSDSNRNVITAIRGFHFYVYYIMNIDWISVNRDCEILPC